MKIVAILATYNEERFVANCVRNLVAQGASIYSSSPSRLADACSSRPRK